MAAVVHARDRLLPDVAALREAHRALDDAGLAGQVLRRPCRRRGAGVPSSTRSDLGRLVADRARRPRPAARRAGASAASVRGQQVDAGVGGRDPDGQVATRASTQCVLGGRDRDPRPARGQRPRPTRARAATRSRARPCGPRSRPAARSCTCAGRAAPPRARCGSVSSHSSAGPATGSACRPGCGPWGPAARRSSPDRGASASHVVRDLALEELGRVRARSRRCLPRPSASTRPAPLVSAA